MIKINFAPDHLLTRRDIAGIEGITPDGVRGRDARGDGPPSVKLPSGRVRYPAGDYEAWLNRGQSGPASSTIAEAAAEIVASWPALTDRQIDALRSALGARLDGAA